MRTRSIPVLPAIALAGVLALTAAACGNAGASGSPSPSASPTAAPATAAPTPTAVANGPRVTLTVADGRNVVAVINDRTGKFTEATSGNAGATMSVQWFKSIVKQIDTNTIEITWVGLPRDEEVGVDITKAGTSWAVEFTQASPPVNSDAEGADRVLVLKFSEEIKAENVAVTFVASNPA